MENKLQLMNDGVSEIHLIIDSNYEIAQLEASDSSDKVFININKKEAEQIINGLQKFIDGK